MAIIEKVCTVPSGTDNGLWLTHGPNDESCIRFYESDGEVLLATKKEKGFMMFILTTKSEDAILEYMKKRVASRENGKWRQSAGAIFLEASPDVTLYVYTDGGPGNFQWEAIRGFSGDGGSERLKTAFKGQSGTLEAAKRDVRAEWAKRGK